MRHIPPVGLLILTILACVWMRQSLARSKVYYSTRAILVRGRISQIDLPAGERLRLVSESGAIWRMTNGSHLIEVDRVFLTDDEQLAEALVCASWQRAENGIADQSGGGHVEVEPTRAKILCAP